MNNAAFCVAPVMHTHTWPNGNVYPCCQANPHEPFGNLNEQTFESIWNGQKYKKFRLDLVDGKKRDDVCGTCYKLEDLDLHSKRKRFNKMYPKYVDLLNSEDFSGILPDSSIAHWDYRFNNLCNMSCRTCSLTFSSSWYKDSVSLNRTGSDRFIKFSPSEEEYEKMIESQINTVEAIQFVGGESILTNEHYTVISMLVESNRASEVNLTYNTNLSLLEYKSCDFTEIWPKFKQVVFNLSLDEITERAEYWRHGTVWKVIMANLGRLVELAKSNKSIKLCYNPTISIFNIHRIEEYLEYFVEMHEMYVPNQTHVGFNILNEPSFYSIKNTSEILKEKALTSKKRVIELLEKMGSLPNRTKPVDEYTSMLKHLENSHYNDGEVVAFVEETAKLDKLRNQSMKTIAPEIWDSMFATSNYQQYFDDFVPHK